jgi:hypothetical protein
MRNPWFALIASFLLLAAPPAAHAVWIYSAAGGPSYDPFYPRPGGAALGPYDWNLDFGGGPTAVAGGSRDSLSGGWNFQFGAGYNFNPRAGFVVEFMDAGLGLTDAELRSHQAGDGDAMVWSATLNPVWRFRLDGPIGAYIIGGGGYYQREKRFFEPGEVFVPTFRGGFFAPGQVEERDFDNTGGVNAGMGLTCHIGGGMKFFVEARYHYIFTSGAPTRIIPVTFGLRW